MADPEIMAPGDVIVRVRLAGICGSDLHVYHEREKGLDFGTVMGHEFVGEIVEMGREVTRFHRGDRVMSPFTTSCGNCFYCRKRLTSRCVEGRLFGWVNEGEGLQGVQAEYVRVPLADSTLLALPDGVSGEEALLMGDVLSTGFFCAELAEIEPVGVCVVIGCGPVGLMAVVGARERGPTAIYAVDSIRERLVLAERFGAVPLNYQECDPVQVLREATEGRGADAVLEVVGHPTASELAIKMVRPGGIVASVGVHTEEHFEFSPAEAYDKNLTYKTGRCPARYYMDRLIPLVQEKKYDFASVISHRLPLHQGTKGYEIFDKKLDGCTKVALSP